MRLTAEAARERFAAGRVARLATVDDAGHPHLVPLTFVVSGTVVLSVVDAKPKQHQELRRLANVRANPAVSLLVDHYEDDWTRLWWARADGDAEVLDPRTPEAGRAVDLLVGRYPQYAEQRPTGPVLAVTVRRWVGWSAAG